MGNCNSCESTNVATAKVILHDGRLQEFAYPVRVSQVLEKNPSCFVCNMDDMDFDSFLLAINDEELLQVGKLYFALPVSWLKSPLRGEKMVSLAVKASLAMKIMRGDYNVGMRCGCGVKKDDFVVDFSTRPRVSDSSSQEIVSAGGGVSDGRGLGSAVKQKECRSGSGRGRGGGRGKFTTKLKVIWEE